MMDVHQTYLSKNFHKQYGITAIAVLQTTCDRKDISLLLLYTFNVMLSSLSLYNPSLYNHQKTDALLFEIPILSNCVSSIRCEYVKIKQYIASILESRAETMLGTRKVKFMATID